MWKRYHATNGLNEYQRWKPLEWSGNMLPRESLKIRLSVTAFCAFLRQYFMKTGHQKQTQKWGYYSKWNSFGAETAFRMYFTYVFYSLQFSHLLTKLIKSLPPAANLTWNIYLWLTFFHFYFTNRDSKQNYTIYIFITFPKLLSNKKVDLRSVGRGVQWHLSHTLLPYRERFFFPMI